MRQLPAIACLALVGCASSAPPQMSANRPQLTVAEAADYLQLNHAFIQNNGWTFSEQRSPPKITVVGLEVEFDDGRWVCAFADNPNPNITTHPFAQPETSMDLACSKGALGIWGDIEGTTKLTDAWRTMRGLADPETPAERQRFEMARQSFVAGQAGPTVGEDVRKHKVAAELAIREHRLWSAIDAFEQGLAIAPWWPQGNFNVALLYGELHANARAARYMQRYLQLVPNAANARAAQDKIYEWEGR